MKDTIPHLYSTCHGKHSSPVISTAWPQPWSRGQTSAYNWRNTPSELYDFHSQSQGRCWYFRTALETLSTQIGGRVLKPPARKEIIWPFGSQNLTVDLRRMYFNNPGFDIMIATISWRQMHKTIIFCLNFARQLQTNNEQTCTQNRPTCWQAS